MGLRVTAVMCAIVVLASVGVTVGVIARDTSAGEDEPIFRRPQTEPERRAADAALGVVRALRAGDAPAACRGLADSELRREFDCAGASRIPRRSVVSETRPSAS